MRELEPIWPGAPRHAPQRPFPPYRFVAGLHPHPVRDPDGHSHGHDAPPRADDFLYGVDLYHAGYLWEAHEAWEGLWKASGDAGERELLQGLIQLVAALIKVHAGNERGVRRLSAAARARLEAADSGRIDLAALREECERFFDAGGAPPRIRVVAQ